MRHLARVFLASVLATLNTTALAATFTVNNTSNAGAGSLRQAMLDANAAPNPPHTILFSAAFPQNGVITLSAALPVWTNGQLALTGAGRNPTIDGASSHPILVIGSGVPSVSISSLNFRNGLNGGRGGCLALLNPGQSTGLALSFSRFERCVASAAGTPVGGAIDWVGGAGTSVTIIGSEFVENRTLAIPQPPAIPGGAGGALRVEASEITLEANSFRSNFIDVGTANSGGLGGAVSATLLNSGLRHGSIIDNEFRGNSATPLATDFLGLGGGLRFACLGPCDWFIERNYFRGNSARDGGAIYGPGVSVGPPEEKVALMRNNTFVNNDVLGEGGAVHIRNGRARFFYNSFFGNGAQAGSHLAVINGQELWMAGNVLAAPDRNSACIGSNISNPFFQSNLSQQPCALVTANDLIGYPGMVEPVIDETEVLGVLRFDSDAIVVDGISAGSPTASVCPQVDIRGTFRPVDADGDGLPRCDFGAFEHPAELLFRNGFEP